MRRVLPGRVPVMCLALFTTAALAAPARAQAPDDEVDLVDGTVLHGRVTGQQPGSYVVIQTPDGRSQSLPWSQVKRVATATAPGVAPAPVPAASPATAADVAAPPPVPEPSASADAHVHPPLPVHFEAGVRLGYSFSSGDYASGAPIGSSSASSALPGLHGTIPFTLDAGLRLGPYVFIGGFVQYALLDSSCFGAAGVSIACSGHDVRGGVEALLHVSPRGRVDPWIGLGIGHEWLELDISASATGASEQLSETFDGWNFADVMLGVDFRVGGGAAIGPYLELTSGSFTSLSASSSGSGTATSSASGDIGSQSSHQWFTLGLRGAYEVL